MNRGFWQTNGAFGPFPRQNQRPARFTAPLNPGAFAHLRHQVGASVERPQSASLAGHPGKDCCSECARDGRRNG